MNKMIRGGNNSPLILRASQKKNLATTIDFCANTKNSNVVVLLLADYHLLVSSCCCIIIMQRGYLGVLPHRHDVVVSRMYCLVLASIHRAVKNKEYPYCIIM